MSSMVCSDKKLTNVVGGKSVRACDNCVKKRARWYCAADDAFLCQSCDSSVHSANPLARRHERVRLKIVSPIKGDEKTRSMLRVSVPTWHRGFTRKPRTPRRHKKARLAGINRLVPEISGEENSHEEQLLYRVPIFDPFVAEMGSAGSVNSNAGSGCGSKPVCLNGFLPSEMDLAEFAADVESLLGKGLEEEVFDMEGLGILDCEGERERGMRERVKVEEEEIGEVINDDGVFIGMGRETFELNFDYDYAITGEEEDQDYKEKTVDPIMATRFQDSDPLHDVKPTKIFSLRLDYKGVISAWDDHKSPWTTGVRPELNPAGECWPHCMGTCGTMHAYGDTGVMNGHAAAMGDGGREARVSRYREKRRTRLFSKKIRYEIRKLNAEKRPRMKGRFVKRANVVGSSLSMVNK